MRTKTSKQFRLLAVAIMATLGGLTFGVSNAGAASSFLRNDKWLAVYSPACGAIGCPYGPGYMVKDNTGFTMVCWADGPWVNGNYNTNRWFRGRVNGISGQVWVPASYVFNQTRVGHC